MEKILSIDTDLFIFLNGLGSQQYDSLWLMITRQFNWIPFFLILLCLLFKKYGAKQTLIVLLFVALLILCTDQMTNMVKNGFQRLRPCNNPEINSFIRIIKTSSSYSFFSGHAANSMAVAMFLHQIFKPYYKYSALLFLWPLVFAYSRIYLGLHYPLDIASGYLFGASMGILIFNLYQKIQKRNF